MASLVLTGPAGRFIPAAGLPWYLAIFGRDSSITAMQSLILGPDIPYGTLRQLGSYQGTVSDAWREEEPGKIPHEVRSGELATLGSIPFDRYYGSVDATPLYVMLFAAVCRWSGWLSRDGAPARRRRPPSRSSSSSPTPRPRWAGSSARRGDDGLVWYGPARRGGIRNQAWKDSRDSMRYADGRIAAPGSPRSRCRATRSSARRGMAEVYAALGRQRRRRPSARGSRTSWRRPSTIGSGWTDEGTYALALDADGGRVDGVGSNAGHLLWAGVVPRHARRLGGRSAHGAGHVHRLGDPHPLVAQPRLQPGRLPHRLGLAARHEPHRHRAWRAPAGSARRRRVFDALLDAADADQSGRLPELFAGFDARQHARPRALPDRVRAPGLGDRGHLRRRPHDRRHSGARTASRTGGSSSSTPRTDRAGIELISPPSRAREEHARRPLVGGRGHLPGLSAQLRRCERRRHRRPGRHPATGSTTCAGPMPPWASTRIWLSPIYPSPLHDFGYDISDYTDVAPEYGTLDDLDALIAACHERGLRLLMDLVPCHTSIEHPWFVEARSSRASPKRDWYIWADAAPGGGPAVELDRGVRRLVVGVGRGDRASTTSTRSTPSSRT